MIVCSLVIEQLLSKQLELATSIPVARKCKWAILIQQKLEALKMLDSLIFSGPVRGNGVWPYLLTAVWIIEGLIFISLGLPLYKSPILGHPCMYNWFAVTLQQQQQQWYQPQASFSVTHGGLGYCACVQEIAESSQSGALLQKLRQIVQAGHYLPKFCCKNSVLILSFFFFQGLTDTPSRQTK
jgi:hypothetical protein